MFVCVYTHTHVYIYKHICVCTHTHTHTHTLDAYAQKQDVSIFWGNGHLPFTIDRKCHVDKLDLQAVFEASLN